MSNDSQIPTIWVLTDDKPGNRTQAIGVAEKLPWDFIEKNIQFNKLSRLPNRLLGHRIRHADLKSRETLTPPWPDIAIAAGRRLAPVLLYIKRKNPDCIINYIMRPQLPMRHFDLVSIPEHDKPGKAANIFPTSGAPHALTIAKTESAAKEWAPKFADLPSPHITLLVGGPSKSAKYHAHDFHELGELSSQVAKSTNGSLLVSTSRRTGKRATDYLRLALSVEHKLFNWTANAPNPYHAFLGLADAIIVTGDSMSMCAEACALGKPVFIYIPKYGKLASKLRRFHQSLFDAGLALPLTFGMDLAWLPSTPLDEAGRLAKEIENHYAKLQT